MADAATTGASPGLHIFGTGSPLWLIHGSGGNDGRMWARIAPLLPGYAVLAPDLHGCGEGPSWPGEDLPGLDDEAASVAQTIRQTQQDAAIVGGHSYGAGVALRLALTRPEPVRGLVLIDYAPVALLRKAGERALADTESAMWARVAALLETGNDEAAGRTVAGAYLGHEAAFDAVPPAVRERMLAGLPQVLRHWRAMENDPTTVADLQRLDVPVGLIVGARTSQAIRRQAEIMAEVLPAARLATVANAGHLLPVSHPQETARAIADVLAWLESAGEV